MYDHLHHDQIADQNQPARRAKTPAPTIQHAVASGAVGSIGPRGMLSLQRAAGNAGVGGLVQRQEEDRHPVRDVIEGSGGEPLSAGVKQHMEHSLGHDFSDVRVHTDSRAADSAASVQAKAYTAGSNVVFGAGQYQPDTTDGARTLAHELSHVVQQRSGPVDGTPVSGGIQVSDPSDRFERAADSASAHVTAVPASVQREGEEVEEQEEPEAVQTDAIQRDVIQREVEPEALEEEG